MAAFLDRIGIEYDEPRRDSPELKPDAVAVRLLDSSGVGRLAMTEGARRYLGSRLGVSALIAEGVCLADPLLDRDEVRLDVGDLAERDYKALAIVALG